MTKYPEAKILFIDDEPNVLAALERAFIYEACQVFTANSGAKGLAIIEKHGPFQVIISDYRMPYMNGDEFLKEVYDRWPKTERVVLSGYVDIAAIVAAINQGHIYKFIPKPWNDDDLRSTIRHCLERYYQHQKELDIIAELGYFHEILSQIPAGVITIGNDNIVTYYNESASRLLPDSLPPQTTNKIPLFADSTLQSLVAKARNTNATGLKVEIGGQQRHLLGRNATLTGHPAFILMLLED